VQQAMASEPEKNSPRQRWGWLVGGEVSPHPFRLLGAYRDGDRVGVTAQRNSHADPPHARAASGNAAALPSSVMNSRRFN
jgi:hypothetical protein